MDVHYTPGDGVLLARADRWLLLDAGEANRDSALLEQLWQDLAHPDGLTRAVATVQRLHPGAAVAGVSGSGEQTVTGAGSVTAHGTRRRLAIGRAAAGPATLRLVAGMVPAAAAEASGVAPAAPATGSAAIIAGIPPEILAGTPEPEEDTARRSPVPEASSDPVPDDATEVRPARPDGEHDTDHDSHTQIRSGTGTAGEGSGHLQQPTSDTVLAAQCAAGHLTDAVSPTCRTCGGAVPSQEPRRVLRPPLGVLVLPDGDRISLDRPVVLGRSPQAAGPGDWPHLVRLPHDTTHLSRMHLRVELDGWHVLALDLGSRGGTIVTAPGRDPERIRPGEPHVLEHGTTLALAETYRVTYLTTPEESQ